MSSLASTNCASSGLDCPHRVVRVERQYMVGLWSTWTMALGAGGRTCSASPLRSIELPDPDSPDGSPSQSREQDVAADTFAAMCYVAEKRTSELAQQTRRSVARSVSIDRPVAILGIDS
jgi:hypothetical protein